MTNLLEIQGLRAGYGRVEILHGVDLANRGTANLGLFGPNGHGKTTLLRTISGLQRATAGAVRFDGHDISSMAPQRIVELGLIHVPQGSLVFPDLTIREALQMGENPRRARALAAQNRERAVSIFPKLAERWQQQVRTLSGGERQMVAIAVALMCNPRLLVLDEPTLGLAPKVKDELCAAIKRISAEGVTLVVVEQDVEFLLELTGHLYLINHGRAEAEIAPGETVSHARIIDMYFGSNLETAL